MGITQPRSIIQRESIDEPLLNRIWDIIRIDFLGSGYQNINRSPKYQNYLNIWIGFFEHPSDQVPSEPARANGVLRDYVYTRDWWEIYNLLEFVLQECTSSRGLETTVGTVNHVLKSHLAAYRWIDGQLVPTTDDTQITAIEEAVAHPLTGVRTHLSKALDLLSDRETPDVENSIKESISAVESICSAIVGRRATLGDALKKLKVAGVEIHGATESAWGSMYGFTSGAEGIRHAMQDEANLTVADAMYFVVICSAFVTLLTEKAQENGITLSPVK